VVALTAYIATFSHRGEYGLLKALGARNGHLYRLVLSQVLISVMIGFVVSLGLTALLSVIVPLVSNSLLLAISQAAVIKVVLVSLVIALIAAILPVWQITRLDPALVFKGGL
jgi:ABC-type antimicrobial peptide transport system permease subunit